ncbi:MAG: metal-dependent transcriptional regulator [Spirochaetia bacterium]
MTVHNELTPRAEEYLEAILNMKIEGKTVQQARLAERLRVSAPTVSGALGRLARDGLIRFGPGRAVTLTEAGELEARTVVRRHRLLEVLLTEVLGVDWAECHEEACLLEHATSERLERKLAERLGNPESCPHGNPIPGDGEIVLPDAVQLSTVLAGSRVRVVRISEEATLDLELMRLLERKRILPGRIVQVHEVAPSAGTITLQTEEGGVPLGTQVAKSVWVTPVDG